MHDCVSVDVASCCRYVPDLSLAVAGKRIHHRWAERLGEGGGLLHNGGGKKRRPQSTFLTQFPTEAIFADHARAQTDPWQGKNSADKILASLKSVKDGLVEKLVFQKGVFEGFEGTINSGVNDGSVLVSVGPINVHGFSLDQVRNILREVVYFSSDCVRMLFG